MTETRVARLLSRIREPHRTAARLIFAIGTSFASVVSAGQGVWTSGGPYGGDIRAIAIDPVTPSTLYAGTHGDGVYKSSDSGVTWTAVSTGQLSYANISALSIDPVTPSTIYAGTDGNGVFKSTDSGGTWAAVNTGLTQNVTAMAINPVTPATLYAAGYGVFKSTDSGGTWTAAGLDYTRVTALAVDPITPSKLYAATNGGARVFKSTDAGATWAEANIGLTNLGVLALAINPMTPSTLYAGTDGDGVFKSTDAGATWSNAGTWPASRHVLALAIHPMSPSTLYAGTDRDGVVKSTDCGMTWSSASAGLTNPNVQALAINPVAPATLFAGTGFTMAGFGGVFKSTDSSGTWAPVNTGLAKPYIQAVAINPTNPTTLYAAGSVVFKSTDSGRSWSASTASVSVGQGFGPFLALALDPSTPSTLYGGTYRGGVFKSTDSGDTLAPVGLSGLEVSALVIDPSAPSTLYAGTMRGGIFTTMGGGVFKSTDSGRTWAATELTGLEVFALAIDPSTPSTIYAGTGYLPYSIGWVFKSTDSGGTWDVAGAGLPNAYIASLAIDPTTPSTLFAGTIGAGVYRSADSGGTWVAASTGLTSLDVAALAINRSVPTTIYAGAYGGGVFKSANSGGTWAAVSAGLPSSDVAALALDSTGTTLYAGSRGVWQASPPPYGGNGFLGFVPIVLDVTGLARYTSELQLTNLGTSSATVSLSYTSSIGSGSGGVAVTVPSGQQVVYPDALSYLRFRGVPIPESENQGGTLLLSVPRAGVHATLRTGSDTAAPQPTGRAGLAYTDVAPASSLSATKAFVYGLRAGPADRSNLALYNMSVGPVSLKVTLVSGDDGSVFEVTAGVPRVLSAYGWYQYNGVLETARFSSGYAVVEKVDGSGPFGAYGVVNDQITNDGSFISALSDRLGGGRLTLPVLVETSAFESELILANRGSTTATFTLRYLESLSPSKGSGGTTTVDVAAGRQKIIPDAIDFLRSKGVSIGARGEASYAGSLQIQVSGVGFESVFAGARTSSLSPAGGQFGVFYSAIDANQEFSELAFVVGLKADANNRSNVAALHTGAEGSGPITLELQVLDGSEGGKAVGQPLSVTLQPGQWVQPPGFFASGGVPNGYLRIRRTAGTAPWYAYGVINDGGEPGQRTGDGSYVPGVRP